MINEEQFELHQNIVNWLMENDVKFDVAMCVANFAHENKLSIPKAYLELLALQCEEEDNND